MIYKIQNELEYKEVLDAIYLLMSAEKGTPESLEPERLVTLVEDYESICEVLHQ
jgi:hypothetical protein